MIPKSSGLCGGRESVEERVVRGDRALVHERGAVQIIKMTLCIEHWEERVPIGPAVVLLEETVPVLCILR